MRYATVAVFALILFGLDLFNSPNPPLFASAQESSAVNPDANGNYLSGDGVAAPTVIFAPDAKLTEEARRRRVTGTVSVWVMVDETGKPKDVHVAKSIADSLTSDNKDVAAGLDTNAVRAVERYRFKPATFQGKAVPLQIEVKCTFRP